MREKGKNAYETQVTKLIEPYGMNLELTNRNGVFRRSVMNPLFNSLFVNECRNDYYYMWRLQNDGCRWMMVWIVGYSFSTLPQSFGVTLSLPSFIVKNGEEDEQNLLSLYTYLINLSYDCWMKARERLVGVASNTKHPHFFFEWLLDLERFPLLRACGECLL